MKTFALVTATAWLAASVPEVAAQTTSIAKRVEALRDGVVSIDSSRPVDARQQALFGLGQTPIPTADLARLYENLTPFALRENFVYVIRAVRFLRDVVTR